MCGIGGIISLNKTMTPDDLANKSKIILNNQSRRGPDSDGIFKGDSFIFCHNRLSIIDTSSGGSQPMQIGDWVITFNGEIYNYQEIKKYLESKNINFNSNSDTEVLLKLIIECGIKNALQKINGMFAFCAYDTKNNITYLVRDRLGEKPLFYFFDDLKNLYFASNPSSIVKCIDNKKWKINYDGLWEYFTLGGLFSENTLFDGIFRMDSAQILTFDNLNISKEYYWTPNFRYLQKDSDVIQQIESSIKTRTIADVPVSLFLSGGIDSSVVAMTIKNIESYHLVSPELEYAEYISKKINSNLNIIYPENLDIEKSLIQYSEFSGEPTMSGFIPLVTSESVSKKHKVAITANGADELFFGYIRIPTPSLNKSFFDKQYLINKNSTSKPSLSHQDQIFSIFRHPENFSIPLIEDNREQEDKFLKLKKLIDFEKFKISNDFSESAKYRWFELMTYVKGDLNQTLDYASMFHSLEVRAPFLDHELVEIALSLDETRHITSKNGRKHFLKEMLRYNNISEGLFNREKIGFSLDQKYLSKLEPLKNNALDNLKKNNFLKLDCKKGNFGRDEIYLKSAALGFYYWKQVWIDSGIVSL